MKKGTKVLAFSILGLFVISLFAGIVSAAEVSKAFQPIVDMFSGLITSIFTAVKPLATMIVGDTGGDPGIFFAKFLMLLVLLAIVSAVLAKFPNEFLNAGWSHWVVSVAVSILGIYFLSPDMIRTILIPNSTLGAVLISALPFIIYFYFVETSLGAPNPAILRRIAWIAYGVVFLIIWVMTMEKISTPIVTTIYPLVVILSLLMAVMDGTIQGFFNRVRAGKAHMGSKAAHAAHIQDELDLAIEAFRRNPTGYSPRTASGTGKTGKAAYLADVKEYKDTIDAILNS